MQDEKLSRHGIENTLSICEQFAHCNVCYHLLWLCFVKRTVHLKNKSTYFSLFIHLDCFGLLNFMELDGGKKYKYKLLID